LLSARFERVMVSRLVGCVALMTVSRVHFRVCPVLCFYTLRSNAVCAGVVLVGRGRKGALVKGCFCTFFTWLRFLLDACVIFLRELCTRYSA
jgi:hypothetical protein